MAEKQSAFLKSREEEEERETPNASLSSAFAFYLSRRSGLIGCRFELLDRRRGIISVTSPSKRRGAKMDHDKTGCQPPPERPVLCINNCGFFGSAATMNMCSKCHKDMMLKQDQPKLASSSIGSIVNGSSTSNVDASVVAASVDMQVNSAEPKTITVQPSCTLGLGETLEAKPKEGPNRCSTCNKRVGLTGFKCRCGNLFCASHRYSDKHECPFDYRTAARDAIAKSNPVVKAEKLDKI